jgi:hypothetical protein
MSEPHQGPEFEMIWRGKWMGDGATTIDELIKEVERAGSDLRAMRSLGVRLREPVIDDYGYLITDDPAVAKRLGFTAVEDADVDDVEDDGVDSTGAP